MIMDNPQLNECMRKNRKLIQMTEKDSLIPSSAFSGRTADALKKHREIQLKRLATVNIRLESLK